MGKIEIDFMGNMVSTRKGKNLFCSTSNQDDSIDSLLYSLNRKDNSFDFIITPRNRITNLDIEMNPNEFNKWSIEAIEPYCVRKEDLEKAFQKQDRKEENKMADTRKILDIFEDIETKRINQYYKEKVEKTHQESEEAKIAKKVRECAIKELKKAFPDYDESKESIITVTFNITDETKIKIEELYKERRKEQEKLDEKIQEINAILEMAETFEQKMQILLAYDVIDSKGVMKK